MPTKKEFKNFNIRIYDQSSKIIDVVENPANYYMPGYQQKINSQSDLATNLINYVLEKNILIKREENQ